MAHALQPSKSRPKIVSPRPHTLKLKTCLTAIVVTTLLLSIAACSSDESPASKSDSETDGAETPERATDFELVLFGNDDHEAGEIIRLSQFQGSPVVLNFWFPSCPPCVAEMPDFETAYQKFKEDGVEFIGVQLVGLDSVEDGQKFVNKLGVNYSLGPDKLGDKMGGIVMDYKISGFPTTVLIDKDGNIRRRWSGALDLEKLEELIRDIM